MNSNTTNEILRCQWQRKITSRSLNGREDTTQLINGKKVAPKRSVS